MCSTPCRYASSFNCNQGYSALFVQQYLQLGRLGVVDPVADEVANGKAGQRAHGVPVARVGAIVLAHAVLRLARVRRAPSVVVLADRAGRQVLGITAIAIVIRVR